MALVKTFTAYELQETFRNMDRDYYSIPGYQAILDLFEETDCGTNTELDVIAICCDFTEEDPEYIVDNYDMDAVAEEGLDIHSGVYAGKRYYGEGAYGTKATMDGLDNFAEWWDEEWDEEVFEL